MYNGDYQYLARLELVREMFSSNAIQQYIKCSILNLGNFFFRYCDPVEATVNAGHTTGVVSPTMCPQGYFCLLNTETKHEYPCPEGSYGNRTELENTAECNLCDAGYYCPTQG